MTEPGYLNPAIRIDDETQDLMYKVGTKCVPPPLSVDRDVLRDMIEDLKTLHARLTRLWQGKPLE